MLVPAVMYKDELQKKFSKYLYSEDYFLYSGYAHCNSLPVIKDEDNKYQYAVLDKDSKVIGYFAYVVDPATNNVYNFGMFSFDRGHLTFITDILAKMRELVKTYHRLEWRMIGGNPIKEVYDKFCIDHNGTCICLHEVTKDLYGRYRDEYIYEILNKEE